MTVEPAQRRLIHALGELQRGTAEGRGHAADPLLALCLGLEAACQVDHGTEAADDLTSVLSAFEELVLAVRDDVARLDRVTA